MQEQLNRIEQKLDKLLNLVEQDNLSTKNFVTSEIKVDIHNKQKRTKNLPEQL